MIRALLIIAIAFAISIPHVDAALNCAAVSVQDQALYNLCPFSKHGTYHIEKQEGEAKEGETPYKYKLDFSVPFAKTAKCGNDKESVFATHLNGKDKDGKETVCTDLIEKPKPKFRLINAENDTVGISVFYENPKAKEDNTKFEMTINLYCNSSISTKDETKFDLVSKADGMITIEAQTPFGCPYMSTSIIEKFVAAHKWLYAAILFFVGLFLLILGITMFKYALFIIVTLAVTGTLGVLFFTFVTAETQQWVLYFVFFLCLAAGLGLGFVAVKFKKWGFLGLGVGAGIFAGLFICTLIQPLVQGKVEAEDDSTEKKSNNEWVFYVIIVVCAALGGFLMYKFRKTVTIIFTSFIGAYLIVRGISLFGKHFPNEISLIRGFAKFDWIGYLYLVGIVIVAIGGIYVQYKLKVRREAEEEKIKQLGYSQVTDEPETAKA